jgi:hypothetical protein
VHAKSLEFVSGDFGRRRQPLGVQQTIMGQRGRVAISESRVMLNRSNALTHTNVAASPDASNQGQNLPRSRVCSRSP